MKVIEPLQANYSIDLIPRFYTIGSDINVSIYSEELREEVANVVSTFSVINGLLELNFVASDFSPITFTEQETYQLKLTDVDSSDIIYRGKILCTSQTPQDFKLGLYTYN